jgi:hypothetical protein
LLGVIFHDRRGPSDKLIQGFLLIPVSGHPGVDNVDGLIERRVVILRGEVDVLHVLISVSNVPFIASCGTLEFFLEPIVLSNGT